MGKDAVELGLPPGLVFASELGEVGEGLVERGVELAELGKKLVAETIPGEGRVGVRGVFAPGLVEDVEVELDLRAADGEERAEDFAGGLAGQGNEEDGMDAAEAVGPGPAEELEEDGFGLVVHGVGGQDGVGPAAAKESVKDLVASVAGGLFEGLAGCCGTSGDVDGMDMERDLQAGAEVLDEALVGVGLGAAYAVVDMNGREADAESQLGEDVGGMERSEESHGVRPAGDGGADAVAGLDVGAVKREDRRCGHDDSIVLWGLLADTGDSCCGGIRLV